MNSKSEISAKLARENKIAQKKELHDALRVASIKLRLANSAEKKAKAKAYKAEKLLLRTQQAKLDAERARIQSKLAAEAAASAQRIVDEKLVSAKRAGAMLSEAELVERSARKIAIKRKKSSAKIAAKSEKAKSRQAQKLVGAT